MPAILEAKEGEHNGGEFHQIRFELDENSNLALEIEASCYGTHSTSFQMLMPCIGPDEVEQFGIQLIALAEVMRKSDESESTSGKSLREQFAESANILLSHDELFEKELAVTKERLGQIYRPRT